MSNGLHLPRLKGMHPSGVRDLCLLVLIVPITILATLGMAVWVLCDRLLGGLRAIRSRER